MKRLSTVALRASCAIAALTLLSAMPCHAQSAETDAKAGEVDALASSFKDPPPSARPWVWWHWMNGNVSADGAQRDLEWMKRVGVGGVQLFEGNLHTPQLVQNRLAWMTPEWKAALRTSAATADRLGLSFGIASSPGWSISGAPFVKPEAAMKKLVWSETAVEGGRRISTRLAQPPAVAGPFQDIAGVEKVESFYRDTLVLAVPGQRQALKPVRLSSSDGALADGPLRDGAYGPTQKLDYSKDKPEAWLLQDFGKAVTVRSVIVGLPGTRGFGAPPVPDAVVEASEDGVRFSKVADLPAGRVQIRTASFAPVTARYFRVRLHLKPSDAALIGTAGNIPGLVPLSAAAPAATAYEVSEFALFTQGGVSHFAEKAGFGTTEDYYELATPSESETPAIPVDGVIDLTASMKPDGSLDWVAPKGPWTILRFGYSLTGHQNGPAPVEATGLEVDKLDADAVRSYAETYLGMYRDAVGPDLMGEKGIKALLSDSTEAGPQNWTPQFVSAFKRLRGYDPVPWLPALTGRIVGDAAATDRFLWDYRSTIADLVSQNHYAVLAAVAHENKLTYYSEALEDHRPQLGDDLAMRAAADVPMGALWTTPAGGEVRQTFVADLQGAASVAHTAGKPLVAAETFTAFGAPWGFAPSDLKATADLAFALGVNRVMIHTSPHQPRSDLKPGMSMAPLLGQYFSRQETWAEMAKGWTDYLARSSFLLQQGRFVADIAYFAGEEAPITALYGETPVVTPPGHGFDFIDVDTLVHSLSVAADGALVTKGGARYPVLMLGGSSARLTLPTLQRVAALVEQGATVIGSKPQASPSRSDDPAAFQALADRLWGEQGNGADVGRGHVVLDAERAFAQLHLDRDWALSGMPEEAVRVLHRKLDQGEFWFVSNRAPGSLAGEISLRAHGFQPELWSADTGEIRPATFRIEGDRTVVSLAMKPQEAVFIVLRRQTPAHAASVTVRSRDALRLGGAWNLDLPGIGSTQAPLARWDLAADPARKYFSGTGTYSQDIMAPASTLKPGQRTFLDLGEVYDVASVRINGKPVGIAWKAPYRVEVTNLLHKGLNRVEVDVANLWVNRLIGDAQPGAHPVTVTDGPTYTPDAPLRPSGLVGPVRLVVETTETRTVK